MSEYDFHSCRVNGGCANNLDPDMGGVLLICLLIWLAWVFAKSIGVFLAGIHWGTYWDTISGAARRLFRGVFSVFAVIVVGFTILLAVNAVIQTIIDLLPY